MKIDIYWDTTLLLQQRGVTKPVVPYTLTCIWLYASAIYASLILLTLMTIMMIIIIILKTILMKVTLYAK